MKKKPDRIEALNDTLQRAASAVTTLDPSGIFIRFLNYPDDEGGAFDHMQASDRILRKVQDAYNGKYDTSTKLGTKLQEKIVEPLVLEKMDRGEFRKPLMVFLITDGIVSPPPNKNSFGERRSIRKR